MIGRKREILNSSVVEAKPLSIVVCTASPMHVSSNIAAKPPCTSMAGRYMLQVGNLKAAAVSERAIDEVYKFEKFRPHRTCNACL